MFEQQGLEGLLPLSTLTQGGAQRDVVEEMIADLQATQKQDLLPLAYAFAALIFEKTDDREWLRRRFELLHDILEESWAYQEMYEEATTKGLLKGIIEGLEQGREQGLQQGLQQGSEKSARETLAQYVELRFPTLVSLLEREINDIHDAETLQRLLYDLFVARTTEDAQSMILHVNGQIE